MRACAHQTSGIALHSQAQLGPSAQCNPPVPVSYITYFQHVKCHRNFFYAFQKHVFLVLDSVQWVAKAMGPWQGFLPCQLRTANRALPCFFFLWLLFSTVPSIIYSTAGASYYIALGQRMRALSSKCVLGKPHWPTGILNGREESPLPRGIQFDIMRLVWVTSHMRKASQWLCQKKDGEVLSRCGVYTGYPKSLTE